MDYSMVGPALVLGLGCIGSSIGCGIGGMAAHAVMSRVEENHGTFIGMSAMAASQSIYGFIVMLLMRDAIRGAPFSDVSDRDWDFCRICSFFSSVYQGMCAASGIQASAKQPAIIGKCFMRLGLSSRSRFLPSCSPCS
jgi:V/A-type H+-transporting ATPase subunit K